MNTKKATKRALLTSVMALVMCVVMLVGTTFAWFTDTASTGVNKIQAGNLDVALEYATAWDKETGKVTKWENAEGKTLEFKKNAATDAEAAAQILWEPGCRYVLPELRIVNKGNLALKYKVIINGIKGDAKLNEAIDWTISYGDDEAKLTDDANGFEYKMLPKAASDTEYPSQTFIIKGIMKEEAGNEYQGLSIDGIGITVVATQYTYEKDSKDDQYDKDAPVIKVTSADNVADIIKNAPAGSVILLTAGSYGKITLDKIDGLWHNPDGVTGQYQNDLSYGGAAGDQYTPGVGIYHKTLADSLTIRGEDGVTVAGMDIFSDSGLSGIGYGGIDTTKATKDVLCVAKNLTIENVTFTDDFSNKGSYIDGLTIKNCMFNDGACINTNQNDKNKISGLGNVSIIGNTFNGEDSDEAKKETRIAISYVENVSIKDNTINKSEYNGIQLGASVSGNISIAGNTIKNTGDRALRISGVEDNTVILISGNTISDAARSKDGKYQVICIGDGSKGVPVTSSISFSNNTYGGSKWADGIVVTGTTGETIICSDNTRIS